MGTSTALSQIDPFNSTTTLFAFNRSFICSLIRSTPFHGKQSPLLEITTDGEVFNSNPTVFISFKDIKFYRIVCHLLTTVPNIKHSLKLICTFSYLYSSLIHVMRSPCNMISLTVTILSPSKILLSLRETCTHTQISVHLHYNPLQSFHQKSLGVSANI